MNILCQGVKESEGKCSTGKGLSLLFIFLCWIVLFHRGLVENVPQPGIFPLNRYCTWLEFQRSRDTSRWHCWAPGSPSLSGSSSSVCASVCSVWTSHSVFEGANMTYTVVDFVWLARFHLALLLCVCVNSQPFPSPVPSACSVWSLKQIRLVSLFMWLLALPQRHIRAARQQTTADAFIGIHMTHSVTACWVKTDSNICGVIYVLCVAAGQYTCKEGKNSPCLVYVSFNHKIYVYWKVELEHMESTNLLRVLEEKPEFKSRLKLLGVGKYTDNSEPAMRKMTKFRLEHPSSISHRHLLCLLL